MILGSSPICSLYDVNSTRGEREKREKREERRERERERERRRIDFRNFLSRASISNSGVRSGRVLFAIVVPAS